MPEMDTNNEFLNTPVLNLLKKENIKLYYTFSEQKTNVVYRFNGTMKAITLQYFTEQNTERYIDVLPVLLDKYTITFTEAIK